MAAATSGPVLPYGGAPDVVNPLDGAPLVKDPCRALTAAEAPGVLGASVESAKPNAATVTSMLGGEAGCDWRLADALGGVVAGPTVNEPYGLSSAYKGNQTKIALGGKPTIKELPAVEGYPTVQSTEGFDGTGVCITLTGLSNTQLYVVKVDLSGRNPNFSDPCGLAERVAGYAIDKLKGA